MDDDLARSLSRHCDVFRQLGDREPINSTEAQAVVENIRAEKGHLDDESLQELNTLGPRTRERLLRIINLKRETEAVYTTNISEQLYSSKYRFLYELIQIADDSSYSKCPYNKCRSHSVRPYLRFKVTQNDFIFETNEDGFKRANIEALCASGKITDNDDQIGEKGLGFKAVFSVAEEVQIQSGLWSLCFKHRKGEAGLGMVTPLDAVPEILPSDVTTRITLRYSDEAKQNYPHLLEAIQDLPDTTILFLQKLRRIHIEVSKSAIQNEKISYAKQYGIKARQCTITRTKEIGFAKSEEKCTYLRFGTRWQNLPPHKCRPGRTDALIELAFPIDPVTQQPKHSDLGQHVSAHLPLQRLAQIQFLIQSDFVTSASRESIIDCSWNHALCDGIAALFIHAVSTTFAKPDHPLRYSWLDFLPKRMMEHPWNSIYLSITRDLRLIPAIQTGEHKSFRVPVQLRNLDQSQLHCGLPILPDMEKELYIASEYSMEHKKRLGELGLRAISWAELIDRLEADLARATSRTKNKPAADPWHEAFAKMFLPLFASQDSSDVVLQQRLKNMAIIPLIGSNEWIGIPVGSKSPIAYFPYTKQIPIPKSLSLPLLDSLASTNITRRAFYKALGVEECPKELVLMEIQKLHQNMFRHSSSPYAELQYLFYFHENPSQLKDWVKIPTAGGFRVAKTLKSWYFPSQEEYDMYQLIPEKKRIEVRDVITFMPISLMNFVPAKVLVRNKTWKEWLESVIGARSCPRLTQKINDTTSLSPEMLAILKYNPLKFLATLKAHRIWYQNSIDLVHGDLSECEVPCTDSTFVPLCETYLPTTDIFDTLSHFGLPTTTVDILQLPDTVLTDVTRQEWQFLEHFGVRSEPDLSFFMAALSQSSIEENITFSTIKRVYASISEHAKTKDFDTLQTCFSQFEIIYYPPQERWVGLGECVWRGPAFFQYVPVLQQAYGMDPELERFFTLTLDMHDMGPGDIVNELDMWGSYSEKEDLSTEQAGEYYTYLHELVHHADDWAALRTEFDAKLLVLGSNKLWYPLKECLWNTTPCTFSGYQDVAGVYPALETFFVEMLGVEKATPSMLIQEIGKMAQEEPPKIDDIRNSLVEIGTMLAKSKMDDEVKAALTEPQELKFLPKKTKDGPCVLVGVSDGFAIPDHQRYADAFLESGVLLDFAVHEVQCLHSVFEYMHLTDRYLSSAVTEVSSISGICTEDETLSQKLQVKAYALYCCAAKYKSTKALRSDRDLFNQLFQIRIYTTDNISTNLVLSLGTDTLSVPSGRASIYHTISDGEIKIYVPQDARKRRACYRSQLPEVLTIILGIGKHATFNVSSIVTATIGELEEVLEELDVSPVEWIENPTVKVLEGGEDERPASQRSGVLTLVDRSRRSISVVDAQETESYPELIEQIVRLAQRAATGYLDARAAAADTDENIHYFSYLSTVGRRSRHSAAYDRRIGAAGEAYVYTLLNALGLPSFSQENWRSTTGGALSSSSSSRFADRQNWEGVEVADIVYTDATGELTKYLRAKCEGVFPAQITGDWNFRAKPIQYFVEVKSTLETCGKGLFHLSGGQYKRMESIALGNNLRPTQVYVIIRVYSLLTPNVKMKIFVAPMQFKGSGLEFEAEQWLVTAT